MKEVTFKIRTGLASVFNVVIDFIFYVTISKTHIN